MGNPKRRTKAAKPKFEPRESKPLTIEQRLMKILSREERAPLGPLIFSGNIMAASLIMARTYLEHHSNSQAARSTVAFLAFSFRQEALRRFGHDTIETLEFAKLLVKPGETRVSGRLDSVTHIMKLPNKGHRLDAHQQAAAEQIQKIWGAIGKGLGARTKDLSRLGGGGQILHPMDTMSEELWKEYREVFSPWMTAAGKRVIGKVNGTAVTSASLSISILVSDSYPDVLDKQYGMKAGTCLKALKFALTCYWNPERLAPKRAKGAKIVATGGDSQKQAIAGA